MKEYSYTSTLPMGRTACTEHQCLYKGDFYLYLTVELYLYSPYGPYGLYRASVPVQGWLLPLPCLHWKRVSKQSPSKLLHLLQLSTSLNIPSLYDADCCIPMGSFNYLLKYNPAVEYFRILKSHFLPKFSPTLAAFMIVFDTVGWHVLSSTWKSVWQFSCSVHHTVIWCGLITRSS
jgi:hypothetical protein